jgi:hypothetical protein
VELPWQQQKDTRSDTSDASGALAGNLQTGVVVRGVYHGGQLHGLRHASNVHRWYGRPMSLRQDRLARSSCRENQIRRTNPPGGSDLHPLPSLGAQVPADLDDIRVITGRGRDLTKLSLGSVGVANADPGTPSSTPAWPNSPWTRWLNTPSNRMIRGDDSRLRALGRSPQARILGHTRFEPRFFLLKTLGTAILPSVLEKQIPISYKYKLKSRNGLS